MRILHIADIHIRGLTRHDEIQAVTRDLVEKGRALSPDRIVIAGDIFHTKISGLSAEYFDLLRWFLLSLAEIAPIDIILGNHDFAQSNVSRQDAVSPVVTALNRQDIRLYKNSCVIQDWFPGFNLTVFSIFDPEMHEQTAKMRPKTGTNVALYHGAVEGAITDDGWELKSEKSIGFFRAYDFVLLGDIHAMQYLSSRSCETVVTEEQLKNLKNYEIIEVIDD